MKSTKMEYLQLQLLIWDLTFTNIVKCIYKQVKFDVQMTVRRDKFL